MSEIQRDLQGEKLNNLLSLKLLQICCNPSSEDVQNRAKLHEYWGENAEE